MHPTTLKNGTKSLLRFLKLGFVSLTVTVAAFFPTECADYSAYLYAWVSFFYDSAIAKTLLVICTFAILYKIELPSCLHRGFAILAAAFGIIQVVSTSFYTYNDLTLLTLNKYQVTISIISALGYAFIMYYLLVYADQKLSEGVHSRVRTASDAGSKAGTFFSSHIFAVCFVAMLICWAPFLIVNYPATYCYDALSQLEGFSGYTTLTSHHPVLTTLIMGSLWNFGIAIGASKFGCFLYVVLHTVACAAAFSLSIKKMHELGLGNSFCLIVCLLFAVVPLWGRYLQWYEKDPLFTAFMLLFLIYTITLLEKRTISMRELVIFSLFGFMSCMLRNNGIFSVVPLMLVMIFLFKGADRKKLVGSLASILVVFFLFNSVLFPAMGVQKGSIGEALSVPCQQTARYVQQFPDQITDQEKAAISAVLDYDSLAEDYNPTLSDPIKNKYHAADTMDTINYLGQWFLMGLKHPDLYTAAFVNQCYGYFGFVNENYESSMTDEFDWFDERGLGKADEQLETVYKLNDYTVFSLEIPVINLSVRPATYTWTLIACVALLCRRHRFRSLVPFVPSLMLILVCTASPLTGSLRYMLPVVASTPLLVAYTVSKLSSKLLYK